MICIVVVRRYSFLLFLSLLLLLLLPVSLFAFSSGTQQSRLTPTRGSAWLRLLVANDISNSNDNLQSNNMTTSLLLTRKVHNHPFKVLGICGGIGSGKSAACQLLVSQLNAVAHIDTDSMAHSLYDEPGSPIVDEIKNAFGNDILNDNDNMINRTALGNRVFANETAMQQLQAIVWPHVETKIEQRILAMRSEWLASNNAKSTLSTTAEPVIVVEAAVLLDAGWQHTLLDAVWVIAVPHNVALERLMQTRGLSRDAAVQRIEAQQTRRGMDNLDDEVKKGIVTAVIDNSGTREELMHALSMKLKDTAAWYPA